MGSHETQGQFDAINHLVDDYNDKLYDMSVRDFNEEYGHLCGINEDYFLFGAIDALCECKREELSALTISELEDEYMEAFHLDSVKILEGE